MVNVDVKTRPLNAKRFSMKEALEGRPVVTRSGRQVLYLQEVAGTIWLEGCVNIFDSTYAGEENNMRWINNGRHESNPELDIFLK